MGGRGGGVKEMNYRMVFLNASDYLTANLAELYSKKCLNVSASTSFFQAAPRRCLISKANLTSNIAIDEGS
jgi:hypothetical protein